METKMKADGQLIQQTKAAAMINHAGHDLAAAGQVANQTASDYLFADYRQRRSQRTAQTQLAALVLWVQYLHEVGAAATLITIARQWAPGFLTTKEQAQYVDYAAQQQQSLLLYIVPSSASMFPSPGRG